jgi:RNA polymerase sigma-70 factor, ECF subfamily
VNDRCGEDTFSEIFDECAPAILRFAQRRLDSPDTAWDVVSDTFTTAWRHWDRRPATAELLPWLYAIAGNAIRDRHRAAGRQRRLLARLTAVGQSAQAQDPAESVVGRDRIAHALGRLPEADQEVLRLVAWEGLADGNALGLALGLRPGTARSRVCRARRRLRALLDATDARAADPPQPSPAFRACESTREA